MNARYPLLAAVVISQLFLSESFAATKSWQGQGGSPSWSGFLNWSPFGAPQSGDDVKIGDLAAFAIDAETELDTDYTLNSLDIERGADAKTNGHLLRVEGPLTLGGITTGASTTARLEVNEHASGAAVTSLTVEDIDISAGGELLLEGGRIVVAVPGTSTTEMRIDEGGILGGHGVLRFQDDVELSGAGQFLNSGTVQTSRPVGAPATERFTLRLEAGDPDIRIAMYSSFGTAIVNLASMTTLDIRTRMAIFFDGELNLAAGSIFDTTNSILATTARFRSDGVVNVNAGSATPGVPNTAILRGIRPTLEAEAQMNVNSGMLVLEEGINTQATSAINLGANAGLQVDGNSFISGDLNLNAAGASLVVNGDLTINDPSFDWDGTEDAVTRVNLGATLIINSSDIEPAFSNAFNGEIYVSGGTLEPSIAGGWRMSGTLELSVGGQVRSSELMTVDGGEILALSGANVLDVPLVVTGGSTLGANNFSTRLEIDNIATIAATTAFTGAGLLSVATSGDLTFADGTDVTLSLLNEGDLHIADGIGDIELLAYNQTAFGTLLIELGGDKPTLYDEVQVDNTAVLDGLLNVALINGFIPTVGDEFTIISAAIIEGMFDNSPASLPSLPGSLSWAIEYGSNEVILRVLNTLSADVDNDGDVDGADFLMIQRDSPAIIPQWQAEFGSGVPPLTSTQAVPEPATLLLLLIALYGKCWFTIRRMYGPLEPWIDKTWRPSEIQLVK